MRGKIIALVFLLVKCMAYAQAPNALGFPSPNNNFINSIGITRASRDIGVDLYTGKAQVNIPICNLTSKGLSIPVSLEYTGGGGIKLQDYATCVGLGWQLTAGGNISRVVRGYPDEAANGYLGGGWQYNVSHYWDYPLDLAPPVNGAVPRSDGEPDLYNINTPFFNFNFTIEKTGLTITDFEMVSSNSNNYKIEFNQLYPSYKFSYFKVTDASGNKYYFGNDTNAIESVSSTLNKQAINFPSTWYLTAIKPFNSNDSIQFQYISSSYAEEMKHYSQSLTYGLQGCSQVKSVEDVTTVLTPKYLSRIIASTGEIDFSYLFDRVDVLGAGRLNTVTLKSYEPSGVSTNQTYQFKYTYFGSNASDAGQVQYHPSTDINVLRLKLNGISLLGSTPETATPLNFKSFNYGDVNLPSRSSNEFDYWGYYTLFQSAYPNGTTDPLINPELRVPYAERTKANILTGISDMFGSYNFIEYEPNTYYNASTQGEFLAGGLRVKELGQSKPGGGNYRTIYQYIDGSGRSTGQIASEAYKNLKLTNGSSVTETFSEVPFNIYDLNGPSVGYSLVKAINQNGGYTISEFSNFTDYPDNFNSVTTYNPSSDPNVVAPTNFGYKRGILKKQTTFTSSNNKVSEEIFNYTSLTPSVQRALAYKHTAYRIGPTSFSCGPNGFLNFSSMYYTNVDNFRLMSTVHRDYDQINTSQYSETVTNYTYCSNNRTVHEESTKDSKGNTLLQTIWHADDTGIPTLGTNEGTIIAGLVDVNNLDAVIHQQFEKNGTISQEHFTYDKLGTSNKFFLTQKTSYRQNAQIAHRQLFQYDAQNSTLNGTFQQGNAPSTVLYGYNYSYPVAKIVGADYATVISKVSPATIQNLTDDNLRAALQPLRSIPGALITTYTYKPLIGKTSETDVNNKTTTYNYDGLGRLVLIKDFQGNILKKLCYGYLGQPGSCEVNTEPQVQITNFEDEIDIAGNFTGFRRFTYLDINPQSASYNRVLNRLEYYPEYYYDPNQCSAKGEGYAPSVYGYCMYGYRVYTSIYTYHYEFDDGSWSQDYFKDPRQKN